MINYFRQIRLSFKPLFNYVVQNLIFTPSRYKHKDYRERREIIRMRTYYCILYKAEVCEYADGRNYPLYSYNVQKKMRRRRILMTFASTKTSPRPVCCSLDAYALLPFILRATACKILQSNGTWHVKGNYFFSIIIYSLKIDILVYVKITAKSTIQRSK